MGTRPGNRVGPALSLSQEPLPRLFWVTDREIVESPGFIGRAEAALRVCEGECVLQLRAHGLSGYEFWSLAVRLAPIVRGTGAQLWVNDRVDIALAVRAEGVQLGRRGLPLADARRLLGRACRLGASIHDAAEVRAAARDGADLSLLGAIYETGSHPDRPALGPDAIRSAAARSKRPIVAIGGITPERVSESINAGAWGVAVRAGLWQAKDVTNAARSYRNAISGPSKSLALEGAETQYRLDNERDPKQSYDHDSPERGNA